LRIVASLSKGHSILLVNLPSHSNRRSAILYPTKFHRKRKRQTPSRSGSQSL
jgi:hypothetical protein